MKNKQLFVLTLLLYKICGFLSAQPAVAGLDKIRKAYANATNLSAQVEVTTYKDKHDTKGTLIGTGEFRKNEALYYSRFNKEEMLINGSGTLVIDHEEKQIMWFEPLSKELANQQKQAQLLPVDSLLNNGDSIVDKGITNGYHQYIIYNKGIIEQTVMMVDAKTNLVAKLISYYHDTPGSPANQQLEEEEEGIADIYKVVVVYKNNSTAALPAGAFSEGKYISIKNKKPVLTSAFSGYQLIVNTEGGL